MGKSDSVEMKEQMAVAVDESRSVDDRVQALDNFEMVSRVGSHDVLYTINPHTDPYS